MQLFPGSTLAPAILTDLPFSFTIDFGAGTINNDMEWLIGINVDGVGQ